MTSQEICQEISANISPKLEELGIEGFVMSGYLVDSEGKMKKFTVCQTNKNVAIEDGLAPLARFASIWGTPNEMQRGAFPGPQQDPPSGG